MMLIRCVLKDVYDCEMKEELDDLWYGVISVKDQLKEEVKNNLLPCNWKVNFFVCK